jgi:hypothetical protein
VGFALKNGGRSVLSDAAPPSGHVTLNNARGTAGQTRLAKLLGVHPTLIRMKLAGDVRISKRDEMAIRQAVAEHEVSSCRGHR